MRKSNAHIFDEIARRCTIDVAIRLSGGKLVDGRGNVVNHAEIGKTYCSPLRVDRKPSFSFHNRKSGCVRWKDFGTAESGDLIQLVAIGRTIGRSEAAKLIDQELRLNLWTEPRPKTNRESNFKPRTKTNRDLESIRKQVGLAGDNEWLRNEPMLAVGTLFLPSKNGKQFAKEVWGLIDKLARIGRVRGLQQPFSRKTKSLSLPGWRNGLCGISFIRGGKVFVAEGEKDYLAIAATGIYASGVFAPTASLSSTHFQALKDKDVVVFAQADKSGITGAQSWVTDLTESTEIFIPDTAGNDWADVVSELTPAEARETLQQLTPITRKQFLSLDPARYPIPVEPAVHHPNLDVPFMLRVHEAVQQLQSRSVAAILDHLGMEKNKASRSKIYRQLENIGKFIENQELAAPI